jgi:pimeloyl-ACP methyl ester carboxylesterase
MRSLVFVHGRGQQGREPDALRRRWAAGLNKGLTAAGRDPLDTTAIDAIRFPFYADVLWAPGLPARHLGVPGAARLPVRGPGGVRPALLADPDWVLVGHSLGGVVCAELLAEDEVRRRAGLFVAVGAPLGLDGVTAGMRPRGSARPTSPWINVSTSATG